MRKTALVLATLLAVAGFCVYACLNKVEFSC